MKQLVAILLLMSALTLSGSEVARVKILEKILLNIRLEKPLVVWMDNKELAEEFKRSTAIPTTQNCQNSTLLILENKAHLKDECEDKPIFVLDYSLLKDIPQSFGAMFWKNARPNIVIIAPRAKKLSIETTKSLDDFIEDKIW
jgi:hypothetical protein